MKIDLNAAIVSPSVRVWRLFPGKSYKLLPSFLQNGKAFLDFPSLELSKDTHFDYDGLLPLIEASRETKKLIRVNGVEAHAIKNYKPASTYRKTSNRTLLVNSFKNLMKEAKTGDYIISPSTLWDNRVHVGKFTDEKLSNTISEKIYGEHRIPARNVNWIGTIQENKISTPLRNSLRHQTPFSLLEKSLFIEVLSLAHDSFAYGDSHVASIFNDKDDFIDSDSSFLTNLTKMAAHACAELEKTDNTTQKIDVTTMLLTSPSIEYSCSLEVDIHSEGFNRFIGTAVTGLVAIVLLTYYQNLDLALLDNVSTSSVRKIDITNSLSGNLLESDECLWKVSEAANKVINGFNGEQTKKLCIEAQEASERAGLRSSAIAVPTPNPRKP